MFAKVLTCTAIRLAGAVVEVDLAQGLPAFNIVGLPDAAVHNSGGTPMATQRPMGIPLITV